MCQIEVTEEQADGLEKLAQTLKALASPTRLAITGQLATQNSQAIAAQTLADNIGQPLARLERDLRQLEEAEFISVTEWENQPGKEPFPKTLALHPNYLKQMPLLITVLSQVNAKIRPTPKNEPKDEREQTLARFLKNGKVTSWPAQTKRQLFLLEEIAKAFEPDKRYSEGEVSAILKNIYEYDHATLRRDLVDFHFLQRANGIYWKI